MASKFSMRKLTFAWCFIAFTATLVAVAIVVDTLSAQVPPPGSRAFEVASIKPSDVGLPYPVVQGRNPGRYAIRNASLADLIREAYAVADYAVVGGPEWARKDRFDVVATAAGATFAQHPRMLRALLAERFSLRVHQEARQLPVYDLVKARSDGRLGPNLRLVSVNCEKERCYSDEGRQSLRAYGMEWSHRLFTAGLDRPVIDKTGLSGQVDISVRWATSLDAPDGPVPPDQLLLFTAVQEQLGLKLQPSVGDVEVIVIDAAERPKPD